MKAKEFIVATSSGKYVSAIYFLNGLDFETSSELSAQVFEEEAKEFILIEEASGTAIDYLFVTIKTFFSKDDFEIYDFANGYFGICEKNKHGGNCIYGGDSACEDHYNRSYIEDVFEEWTGELSWTGDLYGYQIEL